MTTYDIDKLKDELAGLSLQEKRARLEDVQSEITSEIEVLESSLADVSTLLSEVEEEVNISYNKEIRTALDAVVAAHDGTYPILLNNTLDVEGLRFRLYMLIGGIPEAVNEYLNSNNLSLVDSVKREIIELYFDDFLK